MQRSSGCQEGGGGGFWRADVPRTVGSHILVDTPGQIEIFTWSASGSIITEAIASSVPTVVAYIIDTPRTTAPATFMSNMLYACSCVAARSSTITPS